MTIYVILQTAYYHCDLIGAYSSEDEACKALINLDHGYPDECDVRGIELDSNTRVPLSERAEKYIDWVKNGLLDPAFSKCSRKERRAIAQIVLKEFFQEGLFD